MRRLHAVVAVLAMLVPGTALAQDDLGPPSSDDGIVEDQRYGMLDEPAERGVEKVAPAVVVEGTTALPAPQPGAEVYPRPADDIFDARGGGFGHGIGMSQYGADGAGKAGLDHTDILSFYYPGTTLETRSFGTIRIGLTIDNDGTTRVAHRPGLVVSAGPGGTTYPLPSGRDQWRVRSTGTGASSCALEGRVNGTWSLTWPSGMPRACPVSFSSPTERTVDLYLPDGRLRVYRGVLTATYTEPRTVETVNALPMQSYLRSVVNAEMPSYFHQEALRSQSVAARTYSARGSNGTSYYDTCDTTACQVYSGRGARTDSGGILSYEHTNTTAAVEATNGQVLTYPFSTGRALATTMYSSSTGGHTAASSSSAHGYLRAHPDPYDDVEGNRRHAWSAQLPAASLESRYRINRVERVQILSRDGDGQWGGRVQTARVEGFTAAGDYTWAEASGSGLMLARRWPYYSSGLSSTYFTLIAEEPSPSPVRLAGTNRWGTSAAVAKVWPVDVDVAYVASGRNFPDALSAAARSGVHDAPVLLTDTATLPTETARALERLSPGRIVVIGGSVAVNDSVLRALKPYSDSGTVQRVAGGDRYGTAAAVASYYPAGARRVYLASGADYPDALSGAALAAHLGAPLLLTDPGGLPPATKTQLARLEPTEVVVLGGLAAVPTATARAAGAYSSTGGFTRLSGTDRYGTAEKVSQQFPSSTTRAVVASGAAFPDALVGAALGGYRGAPLLLTEAERIPAPTDRGLERLALRRAYVVGGQTVVAEKVMNLLGAYLD